MAKASAGPIGMNIAHKESSHVAPGPPCPSGGPAMTPSGQFIPGPFMYMARSRKLHGYTGAPSLKIDGGKALVKGSYTDVEQPANLPAKPGEFKPTGADLTNMAIVGVGQTTKASGNVKSSNKKVCVTFDLMNLCLPGENRGSIHQSEGTLINTMYKNYSGATALRHAARVRRSGDPVAVVTGAVVDEEVDLSLGGMIDLAWERTYDSTRRLERSPLGLGGWTHSFDQWIDAQPERARAILRDGSGSEIELPDVEARASAFVRRGRLTVRRALDDYEVYDHESRLTRAFTPIEPGGRAMLRQIRDAWGNRIELRYEEGRLVEIVDTAQRRLRLSHDEAGRVERVEVWASPPAAPSVPPEPPAMLQAVAYAYSDEGELARVTDAISGGRAYRYDEFHRLSEKRLPSGLAFRYAYDEDGRCVRSAADGGLQSVDLLHDSAPCTTVAHATPEPRVFVWNDEGEVTDHRTLDKSVRAEREYDGDGYEIVERNAAGEEVHFEHDERGNLIKVTGQDGGTISFEYQDDLLVRLVDQGGREVVLEYDARGALIRETTPIGPTLTYETDVHGRTTGLYGPAGVLVTYAYDAHHNLVRETNAYGASHTYTYDALGRRTSSTDPLGRVTRWAYDGIGRPISEEMPDGTALSYTWDAAGNLVEVKDATGLVERMERSGTGVLARRTRPDGTSWELSYDVLERLREIKNPKGDVYRFRYDRAGRLVEEQAFDGSVIRYRHSRRDLVTRVDFSDDTWLEYEHDDAGRIVRESSPHGDRLFEWNELGYMTRAIVDEHGGPVVSEMKWDVGGRLVEETTDGLRVTYTYDEKTGDLATRTLPNGEVTRYFHDAASALTAIDHEGEKVLIQRDPLGREVRRHFYRTGVDLLFAYDVNDRVTRLAALRAGERGAETLADLRWQYGRHARLAAMYDARWGAATFEHDVSGRLVAMRRAGAGEAYEYDAAGSVIGVLKPPGDDAPPWGVRPGNLLVRADGAAYSNDARGRRVRKVDAAGGVTEYVWDCRGQLREVLLPSGVKVLFKYDAFGRRVRKVVVTPRPAGVVAKEREAPDLVAAASVRDADVRLVRYSWDNDELAMEIDSAAGERVFVHAPGSFEPILHREAGETFAYVLDPLGVPLGLLDGDGDLAWSAARAPWGGAGEVWRKPPAAGRPAADTPFRLLGQYFDEETGLAYTRYRYFDAATARWLTPDPLGIDGGPNLLAFDGSPTERVDPLGLYEPAEFQRFLNRTNQPRRMANRAAAANRKGRLVGAASRRFRRDQPGAAGGTAVGNGTLRGHAERGPLRSAQGLPSGGNQSGVGAVGASSPHCGACTSSIINTQGAVTGSRIRGWGVGPNGPNGGWSPPSLPSGTAPGW